MILGEAGRRMQQLKERPESVHSTACGAVMCGAIQRLHGEHQAPEEFSSSSWKDKHSTFTHSTAARSDVWS